VLATLRREDNLIYVRNNIRALKQRRQLLRWPAAITVIAVPFVLPLVVLALGKGPGNSGSTATAVSAAHNAAALARTSPATAASTDRNVVPINQGSESA